jgi:hypothetical protein
MKIKNGKKAREAFELSLQSNHEDRGTAANGPLGARHAAQKVERARKLARKAAYKRQ